MVLTYVWGFYDYQLSNGRLDLCVQYFLLTAPLSAWPDKVVTVLCRWAMKSVSIFFLWTFIQTSTDPHSAGRTRLFTASFFVKSPHLVHLFPIMKPFLMRVWALHVALSGSQLLSVDWGMFPWGHIEEYLSFLCANMLTCLRIYLTEFWRIRLIHAYMLAWMHANWRACVLWVSASMLSCIPGRGSCHKIERGGNVLREDSLMGARAMSFWLQ